MNYALASLFVFVGCGQAVGPTTPTGNPGLGKSVKFEINTSKTAAEIPMMYRAQSTISKSEFTRLSQLHDLKSISIHRAIIEDGSISELERLEKLDNMVFFEVNGSLNEIRGLQRLTHLRELSFHSSPLPPGSEVEIAKLTRLTFLDVTGTRLKVADVESIKAQLPNTKVVSD